MTSAPWILTNSGKKFDLLKPDPASVDVNDIAHHLAGTIRYAGANDYRFTVAQHSVMVAYMLREIGARPEVQLWGLLHDAHEAYTGDITSPMKRALEIAGAPVSQMQAVIDEAIVDGLGLRPMYTTIVPDEFRLVRSVDHKCMLLERSIGLPDHAEWPADPNIRTKLKQHSLNMKRTGHADEPKEAKTNWLSGYAALRGTVMRKYDAVKEAAE